MFRQKWSECRDPERGMSCRKEANVTVCRATRRKVSDRVGEGEAS